MRRSSISVAATALGITLLIDVLRVWLPSIITIFGQAASTPAELMGAFALLWFVLALGAPPLVRLLGAAPVALVAAIVLGGCRAALPATDGGQAQLYVASVGLLAGLVWLAASAPVNPRPVAGLVLGLATATVLHTALDTLDLTWRGGPLSWALIGVGVAGFLALQRASRPGDAPGGPVGPPGVRPWLLVGPALLLSGMIAGSPALAATAVSYLHGTGASLAEPGPLGDLWPGAVIGAALALFVAAGLARPPGGPLRWLAPILLLAGVVLFTTAGPLALIPAILLTAAGLGGSLALSAPDDPAVVAGQSRRTGETTARSSGEGARGAGFAAVGGMVVFAVAAVAYYSAYDLGYDNAPVLIVLALLVGAVAGWRPGTGTRTAAVRRPGLVTAVAATVTVLAAVAVPQAAAVPQEPGGLAGGAIRVVAYNIRMGFGLDGRFDLDGLVEVVARQRPDVVALSEVDRAWLLNGGHDTLALMARRLGMPYVYAPAADLVWGDAILTRLPVRTARTVALSALGAPTGAQALGVVLDTGAGELAVVATHLQPPPDDGPVVQARETVDFAVEFAAGRPLVIAGDLNTEPGDVAFRVFTDAGLVDALAAARPLPTAPADVPDEQIDHVFVSADLMPTEVAAPASTASDHLPVAVTLRRATG